MARTTNGLLKLAQLLLLAGLIHGYGIPHRLPHMQSDVVQTLDQFAFSTLRVHYPFGRIVPHHPEHHRSIVEYASDNTTFYMRTMFQLVSLKIENNTTMLAPATLRCNLNRLEELVKHSLLRSLSPDVDAVSVKLDVRGHHNGPLVNASKPVNVTSFPLCLNVTLRSPVNITNDQFVHALVDSAINKEQCHFSRNESTIKCIMFETKTSTSLLRLGDFWIHLHQNDNMTMPESQKLEDEVFIFKYNQTWIMGLAVIGGIIGLFFIGCIIAICYTRRPYRRSGKVYEVENAGKKSAKIPQIPAIHPTTKASTLTKNKELYY